MKPYWKVLSIVVVLGAGSAAYWWKSQADTKAAGTPAKVAKGEGEGKAKGKGSGRRGGGGGPVSVRTVTVAKQTMPVVIDAVGTVESEHSVVVKPQVGGVLEAVNFKEGDYVKKGQVLFRIDPRPAQAAVEQAKAAVTRDTAQLSQARAVEARLRPLMEKDYITRQEYDVAATQVKALEATADANKAVLQNALVQLSYTQLSAPIAGRTGGLTVKSGNLVTAGNAPAPLVTINSTQPILVSIGIPQRYLDDVRRYWNTPDLKVQVSATPNAPVIAEGQLIFMDNAVNLQTGTILLKARVRNEKEELWPGQFVSVRIILRQEADAVVLPEAAVQPGQNGPFVYLVRDGKAVMQDVQISRQIGNLIVIAKGLQGGEQAVTDVPPTLADNSPVNVREGAGAGEGEGSGKKGRGRKETAAVEDKAEAKAEVKSEVKSESKKGKGTEAK